MENLNKNINRITFLDGLRGIAILLVILYHAYVRWPSIVPYGNEFSDFPLFEMGYTGVQLFFLISGFVILMTLEKSKKFSQFIIKRWLRLFPAMFIATVFIFFTAKYLPERPAGIPKLSAVIPGLTFIDPKLIQRIIKINPGVLEGAFWSLFVEVKYYFIFGLLYFYFGKKKAITGVFAGFIMYAIVFATGRFIDTPSVRYVKDIVDQLSFQYFGWFTGGSLAYLYYTTKNRKYMLYALIAGFLSAFLYDTLSIGQTLSGCLVLFIFMAAVYFEYPKKLFSGRFFVFFGFISYPLYLIHENAMIALIVKVNKYFTSIPNILLPIIPILFLIMISYLIAKLIEPAIQKLLKNICYSGQKQVREMKTA